MVHKIPMSPQPSPSTRWFVEEVQPHEPALRVWLRARFPSIHDPDDLVPVRHDHGADLVRPHRERGLERGRSCVLHDQALLEVGLEAHGRVVATARPRRRPLTLARLEMTRRRGVSPS